MKRRRLPVVLLLTLGLASCEERDEAIPPTLAGLHRRATGGDAAAQLDLGLGDVIGKGIAPHPFKSTTKSVAKVMAKIASSPLLLVT